MTDSEFNAAVQEGAGYKRLEANHHFNAMAIEHLADRQLIELIEMGQRELDTRHGMNRRDLTCPNCGRGDYFRLRVSTPTTLLSGSRPYLEDDDQDNFAWGADRSCTCVHCDHEGPVLDFLPTVQKQ